MSFFTHLFGHESQRNDPDILPAVERAVTAVEPLLMQMSGYPKHFRKPVASALEYAHSLAVILPGPVSIDRESYAKDAFVHALFPDVNYVEEAIRNSVALEDYLRKFPASQELYALMGMRRFEKSVVGMELSGGVVQHDVVQKAVYFTSHTIENPSPSELHARELIALSLFDSLVGRVKKRVEQRKREKQEQMLQKDMLASKVRAANELDRPALEVKFAEQLNSLQATASSLELGHYVEDFEAVLLHPEEYLRLDQTPIVLDSMGIRRANDGTDQSRVILFNDLIGYDRRDWTVTMVHCNNLESESFASRLDEAYRRLSV